jgi:hypothetical protein
MFKHFIVTRFNLSKSDWTLSKTNKSVLTEEWYVNRFNLFSEYCYHSVKHQSNKNFEWLVFFDINTPEIYLDKIESYKSDFKNFKPFFIDGQKNFNSVLTEYIGKHSEAYVITSGLDNDDCISNTFVASVQEKFNQQDFLYVDYINGLTLQINSNVKLGKKLHLYNPFASLIEKNDNPKTIYHREHMHWKKEKKAMRIEDEAIWCSIIHNENMVNEYTGYGNIDIASFFSLFDISPAQRQFISNNLKPNNLFTFSNIRNYLSSNWNVFFKDLKKSLGLYND